MFKQYLARSFYSALRSTVFWLAVACLTAISLNVSAIDQNLAPAEEALKNQQYERAKQLFSDLSQQANFKVKGTFGLARVAFFQGKLDLAEDYIEEVLEQDSTNPEHFYYAARIAGKQAQTASVFTKLGYAKDTKNYFTQALQVDNQHRLSIIGLIGFHRQAPVIAGGDKDAIAGLLDQLRVIDKRAAFAIEAPLLFEKKQVDKILSRYQEASQPDLDSQVELGEFKFNFAMLLASQSMYRKGLKELISIEFAENQELPSYANMRLYQIAKLAAESNSELDFGIQSINEYAAIAEEDKTIPKDWVNFRSAQLSYLKLKGIEQRKVLEQIKHKTKDGDLKDKIKSVLKAE